MLLGIIWRISSMVMTKISFVVSLCRKLASHIAVAAADVQHGAGEAAQGLMN